MNKNFLKNYINDDEMLRVTNTIKECEKYTSGEICISIKNSKPLFKQNKSIAQLAHKEFFKLGLQNTKDRTAVMIFIILKSREFYVMADEGIHSKVNNNTWHEIKDKMALHFTKGNFADGLISGIKEIGRVLKTHFPPDSNNKNELPDIINT